MSRSDTNPIDILNWILDRLRAELDLTETTCFLSSADLAPQRIPPASVFVTVSPLAGRFDVGEQTAGNIYENWSFRVRVYLRLARDRTGHDDRRLVDPADGVFAWKRKVLKALCGRDIPSWNLKGTLAAEASAPLTWLRGGDLDWASFAIDFVADFAWDIT